MSNKAAHPSTIDVAHCSAEDAAHVAPRFASTSEDLPANSSTSRSTSISLVEHFDRWLFDDPHPVVCSILRVAYASLLVVYLLTLYPELEYWFTDAGVLKSATVQETGQGVYGSLLFWLPSDLLTVTLCWTVMFVQAILLWLGCWSRIQVVCLFFGLVSFQHRNMFIFDGQDTLLRLLTFAMIFMPLDYRWSLGRWLRNQWGRLKPPKASSDILTSSELSSTKFPSAWGLRLVQLQITAIYLSTAWEKFQGVTWREGTALFYVSRMDDLYGRFPLPDGWFETPWILAAMTWGVVAAEALIPVALWWKPTRPWGLLAAIALHLSIEVTMHIFVFEWLMIVALLAFLPVSNRLSRSRLAAVQEL